MADEVAFQSPSSSAEVDAWREMTLLLLSSAVDHAVHCNEADAVEFRKRAREAAAELRGEIGPQQVLITAGSLAQSLAQYNQRTQEQVDALLGQSRSLLQRFVDHLAETHRDAESEDTLKQIRLAVEQPGNAAAQQKVTESLQQLGRRTAERFRQMRELAERLQDRVTILEQSAALGVAGGVAGGTAGGAGNGSGPNVDACTGLPVRAEAEVAIRSVIGGDRQCYVAVFYVHRMALTNARFGEAIGNQVILFASQHVATAVAKQRDLLFRWTGPAFVAVLERDEALLAVNSEVQRVISAPVSRFFETPNRSVYLPIKISGEVISLEEQSYAEVAGKIERFILNASGNCAGD